MDLQVLTNSQNHRTIPELCLVVGVETRTMKLVVKGRKFSCCTCDIKSYLRAFCHVELERQRKRERTVNSRKTSNNNSRFLGLLFQ